MCVVSPGLNHDEHRGIFVISLLVLNYHPLSSTSTRKEFLSPRLPKHNLNKNKPSSEKVTIKSTDFHEISLEISSYELLRPTCLLIVSNYPQKDISHANTLFVLQYIE